MDCCAVFQSGKNSASWDSLIFVAQLIVCCSEYSMQLNASRIKVLQAQDDVISSMKEAASKELLNVSHHHDDHVYRNLLKDLIVQVSWILNMVTYSGLIVWFCCSDKLFFAVLPSIIIRLLFPFFFCESLARRQPVLLLCIYCALLLYHFVVTNIFISNCYYPVTSMNQYHWLFWIITTVVGINLGL